MLVLLILFTIKFYDRINIFYIAKVILFTRTTNHLQLDLKVAIMKTSYCVLISRLKNLNTQ